MIFLRAAADLVFPVRCSACGDFISRQEGFCVSCRGKLKSWKGRFFVPGADKFLAAYEYGENIKPAIALMKQGICGSAPYAFGKALGKLIRREISGRMPDMIVSVPMHKSDRRRRGCNQADLVAKVLGQELGIPVRCDAAAKIRKTAEQKRLDRREREINLRGAFSADRDIIGGRSIILLDDICTTGSTLRELSKVMRNSGASHILCVCCCKAEDTDNNGGEV